MKKSPFLINTMFLAVILFSCQNNMPAVKPENQSSTGKSQIESPVSAFDTIKNTGSAAQPGSAVFKTDTIGAKQNYKGPNEIQEAPKHGGPNQSEVDSIKKSKERR